MTGQGGIWALGDFAKVARETITGTGDVLVEACGIGSGQRVLDVAAGSGNVAIPAARAGAAVVASDITPELLEAGRAEAERQGLALEWVEADAQALPFEDDAFDVVTSSFGVMFAPDQRAAAAELARVCRPGGTIGLANWTPGSWVAQFFATLMPFRPPPPPGFQPPVMWGEESHLRELLGAGIGALRTERRTVVVDRFPDPAAIVAYYSAYFGPVVAARAALGDDPARLAELDRALLELAERTNGGPPGGPARYELEYLLAVAQAA